MTISIIEYTYVFNLYIIKYYMSISILVFNISIPKYAYSKLNYYIFM